MNYAGSVVPMDNPLSFVMMILLDSTDLWHAALKALYIAGVWKVLEKSGVRGWNALIPWVREYKLACCANREPEGRIYCLTDFGRYSASSRA